MVAQVQVFIHVVFNNKGLVAVQTASTAVWVQHGGEGTQVALTEGRDEALVKAQFIQEDLEQQDNEKNIMNKRTYRLCKMHVLLPDLLTAIHI